MRFSIITPSYNSGRFLEGTLRSIIAQLDADLEVELIVIDGGSSDQSVEILERYREKISQLVVEKDHGPANAINKGLALSSGEIVAWLNADDLYYPGALARVRETMASHPAAPFCFGKCPIIDSEGGEVRTPITRFKEAFYPVSSRFTYQCINYLSQPALFFRRSAWQAAGPLREDMVAAWDFEFILRLWRQGRGVPVPGAPLAAFRWHDQSISGRNFTVQFAEELAAAAADAGRFAPQTLIHHGVRWGIVGAYQAMSFAREIRKEKRVAP
jgi:glycosyltransferase involved in cell wall biosynthesis